MKKLKQTVCFFLCALLSLPAVSGLGADYDGHWAEKAIAALAEQGIVSGDETGNFNPDKQITRAETVKLVNKVFRLEQKSESGFPDVSESDWYYEEFLIAKGAGYLQGDSLGNANPEQNITRQEVCVMLAKAAGMSSEGEQKAFTDAEAIAPWAADAVNALVKAGMLNGYEDGSFRPEAPITRAEAASVLYRIGHKEDGKPSVTDTPPVVLPANPIVIPSKPSGGGGSGGGGGSSSQTVTQLPSPVVILLDQEMNFSWQKVNRASSYTVKLSYEGEEAVQRGITGTECDLSELAAQLLDGVYVEKAVLQASVMAVSGNSKYSDSAYSPAAKMEKIILDKDKQIDLNLEAAFSVSEETGEAYQLTFHPDVVSLVITNTAGESKQFNGVTSPFDMTPEISADGGIVSDNYTVVAVSARGMQQIKVNTSFGGGEGTEESPYIVSSLRHFQNVALFPAANYLQKGNIDTGENFKNMYQTSDKAVKFSGTYRGDESKPEIRLNISDGEAYASAFGYLDKATVESIRITGSIRAEKAEASYLGGVAGFSINSNITNVENAADITASGLTGDAYIGGISGYLHGGAQAVTGCVNSGSIVANTGMVGGITGYNKPSDYRIVDCENTGLIRVTNEGNNAAEAPIGGIAGLSYGPIENCVNSGEVENQFCSTNNAAIRLMTGGIAGKNLGAITGCSNTADGKVKSILVSGSPNDGLAGQTGGIAGHGYKGLSVISGCRNYGYLEGVPNNTKWWTGGIVGINYHRVETSANLSGNLKLHQFGGIAGRDSNGTIEKCYNAGNITTPTGYAGAMTAYTDAATVINDCFNCGNITAKYGAGMIGNIRAAMKVNNYYSCTTSTCTNSLATDGSVSNVTATNLVYVRVGSGTLRVPIGEEVTREELPERFKDVTGWITLPESEDNHYLLPQLTDNPFDGSLS